MSEAQAQSQTKTTSERILFPRWINFLMPIGAIAVIGGIFYVTTLFALGGSPMATAVGYSPTQPVPYSHALHAGKLGIDCRYCHTTVEKTSFAALPPTQTCINCHNPEKNQNGVWKDDPALQPVRDSWATGRPVQWIKVHDLPDYVYFSHAAHVNHGVGCVECHGRIDRMDVVTQVKPLSMSWCLDCHRAPESHLRPKDQITNLGWTPPGDPLVLGRELARQYKIHDTAYLTSCYTCHR